MVEDAATADYAGLDIVFFSAGGCDFARAGADGRRRGRDRDRQFVGLARRSRGAAGRGRGQSRTRCARIPKGIVANPNCTTMAAMPVLKPLHEAAGPEAPGGQHLPGRSGAGVAGIEELEGQMRERRRRRHGAGARRRRR